jgi:hypothetical protein
MHNKLFLKLLEFRIIGSAGDTAWITTGAVRPSPCVMAASHQDSHTKS